MYESGSDYVGFGNHQLDVLVLILLLKLRWPKHVYMLRGDYENPVASSRDGFLEAIASDLKPVLRYMQTLSL